MALYKYTGEWAGYPFSGGHSQLGPNFPQIGGEFPFINGMKSAQAWSWIDNTGVCPPDILDDNGYPVSNSALATNHGASPGITTLLYMPGQAYRSGDYAVTWIGDGEIYQPSGTRTGSNNGANGRFTLSFSGNTDSQLRISLGIRSVNDANRITHLSICHVDDEERLARGEIVSPYFKQRVRELGAGVLRFLDWQIGNTTNVVDWAAMRPVDYAYYGGSEMRSSIYAGLTSGTPPTYEINYGSGGPVDKMYFLARIHANASSDDCTLNLNGTGAVPLYSPYGTPTSAGGNTRPNVGGAVAANPGRTCMFTYDAQLNVWMMSGGSAGFTHMGINNGIPPQVLLQIAAECGCHPWWTIPFASCTPPTDYTLRLAQLNKAFAESKAPWMKPRYEGPNETWNAAGGDFWATQYAAAIASSYGWGSSQWHNWYGKALSIIGQTVSGVYGDDRSKYDVVCGVQSSGAVSTSSSNARLTSAQYVSTEGGSAASNWVTAVAMANYFNYADYRENAELVAAYAYDDASTPEAKEAIAETLGEGCLIEKPGQPYASTLVGNQNRAVNWRAWCDSFSIPNLYGYEGAWSPDYLLTETTSPVTGATQASSCVLTLAQTNNQGVGLVSGNPATVGKMLTLTSVGGMTQLNRTTVSATLTNGNASIAATNTLVAGQAIAFTSVPANSGLTAYLPYYVLATGLSGSAFQISLTDGGSAVTPSASGAATGQSGWFVTNVAGNSVTISVDSSGFSAWTSGGTATYFNAPYLLARLRYATKSVPALYDWQTQLYDDFVSNGGSFPSQFLFGGSSSNALQIAPPMAVTSYYAGSPPQVWATLDPHIYEDSPSFQAIKDWNAAQAA